MQSFEIAGVAARDLAAQYGTPLYVYDARNYSLNVIASLQKTTAYEAALTHGKLTVRWQSWESDSSIKFRAFGV